MRENLENNIERFFFSPAFGVVGASANRKKYGNKVLRVYLQHHRVVYPINPNEKSVEGLTCLPNVDSLPEEVKSISIITPPPVTEKIVEQAILKGIKNIWMQPGAESDAAVLKCKLNQINVISHGPCILVALGFNENDY